MNREIQKRDLGIYLAGAFILASVFNIVGNNQIKNSVLNNTNNQAGKAFILLGLITLIIVYLILINHDYNNYINAEAYGNDPDTEIIKLVADVVVLIGFLLILYYFFKYSSDDEDVIVT